MEIALDDFGAKLAQDNTLQDGYDRDKQMQGVKEGKLEGEETSEELERSTEEENTSEGGEQGLVERGDLEVGGGGSPRRDEVT
jgi:hypothetical protein